jgi:uncharacterized membrane protein
MTFLAKDCLMHFLRHINGRQFWRDTRLYASVVIGIFLVFFSIAQFVGFKLSMHAVHYDTFFCVLIFVNVWMQMYCVDHEHIFFIALQLLLNGIMLLIMLSKVTF